MYAIIAEDPNDVECLKVLIKRLANDNSITIKGKGYGGCSIMLRKGKNELRSFKKEGYTHFIICYDKDKSIGKERYQQVIEEIIKPSGIRNGKNQSKVCILIPNEEMEAWILADLKAVSNVIPSWLPEEEYDNPESITSPKEKIINLSKINKPKLQPLYIYTTHNQKVMQHLDLNIVKKKCPSFRELADFIEQNQANYP